MTWRNESAQNKCDSWFRAKRCTAIISTQRDNRQGTARDNSRFECCRFTSLGFPRKKDISQSSERTLKRALKYQNDDDGFLRSDSKKSLVVCRRNDVKSYLISSLIFFYSSCRTIPRFVCAVKIPIFSPLSAFLQFLSWVLHGKFPIFPFKYWFTNRKNTREIPRSSCFSSLVFFHAHPHPS